MFCKCGVCFLQCHTARNSQQHVARNKGLLHPWEKHPVLICMKWASDSQLRKIQIEHHCKYSNSVRLLSGLTSVCTLSNGYSGALWLGNTCCSTFTVDQTVSKYCSLLQAAQRVPAEMVGPTPFSNELSIPNETCVHVSVVATHRVCQYPNSPVPNSGSSAGWIYVISREEFDGKVCISLEG